MTHGRPGVVVLHKSGWIDAARHDAGLVVWEGGVLVAAVMTHRASGAGRRSDVLAGDVAESRASAVQGLTRAGLDPLPAQHGRDEVALADACERSRALQVSD